MPPLLERARAHASEGEIVDALQDVFGSYTETPGVLTRSDAGRRGKVPPPAVSVALEPVSPNHGGRTCASYLAATVAAGWPARWPSRPLAPPRTISVKDDLFSPKSVTVSKNTTVKWVFKGDSKHNVAVTSGSPSIATRRSGQRSAARSKTTKRGTFKIECTLHSGMNMTLKVK